MKKTPEQWAEAIHEIFDDYTHGTATQHLHAEIVAILQTIQEETVRDERERRQHLSAA